MPSSLAYLCCQLTIPNGVANAASLANLIRTWLTTNRPDDLSNFSPCATSLQVTAASANSGSVFTTDDAGAALGGTIGLGGELTSGAGFFEPPGGQGAPNIDLNQYYFYGSAASQLLNVRITRR